MLDHAHGGQITTLRIITDLHAQLFVGLGIAPQILVELLAVLGSCQRLELRVVVNPQRFTAKLHLAQWRIGVRLATRFGRFGLPAGVSFQRLRPAGQLFLAGLVSFLRPVLIDQPIELFNVAIELFPLGLRFTRQFSVRVFVDDCTGFVNQLHAGTESFLDAQRCEI